jgi:hypothetical protein
MGWPNGELDPWADWIVGQRFRYIQVNGYYEQLGDVPRAKAADLPANPLRSWMAAKVPALQIAMSSDQIGVLAVGVPAFATAVGRAVVDAVGGSSTDDGPPLRRRWTAPPGSCPAATARSRQIGSGRCCCDPRTFNQ